MRDVIYECSLTCVRIVVDRIKTGERIEAFVRLQVFLLADRQ